MELLEYKIILSIFLADLIPRGVRICGQDHMICQVISVYFLMFSRAHCNKWFATRKLLYFHWFNSEVNHKWFILLLIQWSYNLFVISFAYAIECNELMKILSWKNYHLFQKLLWQSTLYFIWITDSSI